MIPDQLVEVIINQKSQFVDLGFNEDYFHQFYRKKVWISWQNFGQRSSKIIKFVCDGCKGQFSRDISQLLRAPENRHLCKSCFYQEKIRGNTFSKNTSPEKRARPNKGKSGIQIHSWKPELSEYSHFKNRTEVLFAIKKKTTSAPKDGKEYKLKFLVSYKDGFEMGLSPEQMVDDSNVVWREKNNRPFKKYANIVRCLTEKTYRSNKSVINSNDYPRTRCGVEGGYQLDHIVSIKEGFLTGIAPEELSKIENLQMLPWKVNRTKHAKPQSSF